jgi:ABC-type multidrug transport system fused ATPase/permease subunit
VERFLLATLFISYLFWAPVQSIAVLVLGIHSIGPSFAAGYGLLIGMLVPMQFYLSGKFATLRSKVARLTDARVTLLSQAISGVRVMKMSGWELQFEQRIADIRQREISQIQRANRLKALNESLFFSSNVIVSLVTLGVHVATGGLLTPRTVYTTLTLINVLQIELTKHLSLAVMGVSECYVSLSRIQTYLEFPEIGQQASLDGGEAAEERVSVGTTEELVHIATVPRLMRRVRRRHEYPSKAQHAIGMAMEAGCVLATLAATATATATNWQQTKKKVPTIHYRSWPLTTSTSSYARES